MAEILQFTLCSACTEYAEFPIGNYGKRGRIGQWL